MDPFFTNGWATLYHASAQELPLPDKSVHMVVCSPPYYLQRAYRGIDERVIGEEATPEDYLDHLLACFREVRRVLHDTGVVFVNLGDKRDSSELQKLAIPERFGLAMQSDGWLWRETIVWVKSNPLPESQSGTRWERCRIKREPRTEEKPAFNLRASGDLGGGRYDAKWEDCPGCKKCQKNGGLVLKTNAYRPSSAYELIFMFAKGPGYWSDGEGVRRPHKASSISRYRYGQNSRAPADTFISSGALGGVFHSERMGDHASAAGANLKNVWDFISPESPAHGHHATFPVDLPETCIKIATSEAGCCPNCKRQWAPVIGDTDAVIDWKQTCKCPPHQPEPSVVLDIFAGTMTTCIAAMRLGRKSIGVDISLDYLQVGKERLEGETLPMKLDWGGT